MIRLIIDMAAFIWGHSSTRAAVLIIGLAQYMTTKDVKEMSEYLCSLAESRREKAGLD